MIDRRFIGVVTKVLPLPSKKFMTSFKFLLSKMVIVKNGGGRLSMIRVIHRVFYQEITLTL